MKKKQRAVKFYETFIFHHTDQYACSLSNKIATVIRFVLYDLYNL